MGPLLERIDGRDALSAPLSALRGTPYAINLTLYGKKDRKRQKKTEGKRVEPEVYDADCCMHWNNV